MHPSPRWALSAVRGLAQPSKAMDMTPYITPYLSNDAKVSEDCLNDKKICRDLSPMDLFKADKTNKEAVATLGQLPSGMPILVIAGEDDKVMHSSSIPKTVEKFGSKNVSVNIIPNKGHLLLEHQIVDAAVSNVLNSWLDKTQIAFGVVAPQSTEIASQPEATETLTAQRLAF
jgi:alpha-beta hydrolase superfamily lysophospholipase